MFTPEYVFCRRYRELERLGARGPLTDWDALDAARILRQLLIDRKPLALAVSRVAGLALEFLARDAPMPPMPKAKLTVHVGPIDPTVPMNVPDRLVDLRTFLSTGVLAIEDRDFDVRSVIKSLAEQAGGVHYESDGHPRRAELADALTADVIDGLPTASRICMEAIRRNVLVALDPLFRALTEIESLHVRSHWTAASLGDGFGELSFEAHQFMTAELGLPFEQVTVLGLVRVAPGDQQGAILGVEVALENRAKHNIDLILTPSFEIGVAVDGLLRGESLIEARHEPRPDEGQVYRLVGLQLLAGGNRLEVRACVVPRVGEAASIQCDHDSTSTLGELRIGGPGTSAPGFVGHALDFLVAHTVAEGELREIRRRLHRYWGF